MTDPAFIGRAVKLIRGHSLEDFEVGRLFEHHWGRTITEGENATFTTLTLNVNPHYFNAEYARAHGHPGVVINPMLVFNVLLGLSAEDLIEGGGALLGVDTLTFRVPVYPGDTLTARSTVLDRRDSKSRTDCGIVTCLTEGYNQHGVRVIDFKRVCLKPKRLA